MKQQMNSNGKNGSVNDRPLFMQNNNRSASSNAATDNGYVESTEEIGNFRNALPQFLAVSVKNILLFVYGMTLGFPTIVIPAIQGGEGREPSDIVLDRDQISWFSSINLICVPLGCIFSGPLTQPLGKRRAMQFVNLPILASWLLFHFSTKTEHLYAALCLSGLGGGLMEAPVLTYVAEITEPKYRGILSALGSTCVITGVFIQFIMGSIMDWRTIAAVSSAFPVISIITLCFIPESPTWLIRERRFREAVKALQWLRGWVPEYKIEGEFNRLYEELITAPALEEAEEHPNSKPSKWKSRVRMFRKRSFLVPFLLVAYTFFTGHFSGKTPLQTYAVQIFHTLKAPINKYHATILLGIAELVATIMCVFLIHFTGKRPLVLISTIGVGICFFGTATYAHYLKVVPGFAVNNVVVNASSIVPKESIISQDNITKIFETEKNALHVAAMLSAEKDGGGKNGFEITTTLDDNFESVTLFPSVTMQFMNDSIVNRTRRDDLALESYNPFNNFDSNDDNITFVDLASLDYDETNSTAENYTTPLLDLVDSEEEAMVPTTIRSLGDEVNTKMVSTSTTVVPADTTKATEKADSDKNKNVVNEILLPVPQQEHNKLVWLPLILLLGSAFFSHFGIRMIPWILIGEVFPAPVRSTASGLVSALGYIFGFLANKLFLQMLTTLTMPGTFWFYAAVAFTGTIVLYFTLPETEGRTLGEIEEHFSKKSKTNLLSKSPKKNPALQSSIQMDNLENLHIPIDVNTEARIIKLQQSDLIPNRQVQGGTVNLGFKENDTTHL